MSEQPTQLPSATRSILYGAAVMLAISLIPYVNLVNIFGVGMFLGSGFAVYHFARQTGAYVSFTEGFRIGVFAALCGAVLPLSVKTLFVGGMVIDILRDVFLSVVLGGLSGVIFTAFARRDIRKSATEKQEEK